MPTGRIVFSQLMDFVPRHQFNKCVLRYRGNYRARQFKCYDQFLCMAFAQLTGRESLRDIETCLRAMQPKLYHAGIQGNVSKSTLADANEKRDWRIYAEFAQVLIRQARTPKTTSEYNSKRLRMSSIPAPSIGVFPFSRGLDSVGAKPPSSSTR